MVTLLAPLATQSGVRDLYISEDRYLFTVTSAGVSIIDLYMSEVISSGIPPGIATCVTVDTSAPVRKFYVGTSGNGIFSGPYNLAIHSSGLEFSSYLTLAFSTGTSPAILSDYINSLSAANGGLLISSSVGVDFITNSLLGASRTVTSGSSSCVLTNTGEAYWTVVNSGIETCYNILPSSGTGVIPVSFQYDALTSVPPLPSNVINDIAVSKTAYNTLGFATGVGGFIVREMQGSEGASLYKSLFSSDNISSVSFSSQAAYDSGRVYLVGAVDMKIFSLSDNTVFETYNSESGPRGQTLASGTLSKVRTSSSA